MIRPVPNGVYPTMITPYTDNNEIDYNAVLQILQWYTEKGVTAVFAICQSSEIFFLSFEERLELLRFIMRNKPAGMTVVASGNTSADPDTILREAEAFIETGIDGYVFIANRFAAEDEPDEVLAQRMLDMAERLPQIPLGVYECPYPYKRVLTPDVLRLLSSNEKFCFRYRHDRKKAGGRKERQPEDLQRELRHPAAVAEARLRGLFGRDGELPPGTLC